MMRRTIDNQARALSAAVRRQSTSTVIRRYAASLPHFAVAEELPDHLAKMLDKIELAEKRARSQGNNA